MARAQDYETHETMPASGAPGSLAERYAAAFPDLDVDLDSLAAHLALARIGTLITRGVEAQIKALGFDLTRPRYTILRMLYLTDEKVLLQSQLAQFMGVSGPYVTQMIDSLVQDGWVERVVERPNRRFTSIKLTPVGTERCAQLIPGILRYMADSMSGLTLAERRQVADLGRKIQPHISPS